MFPKINTASSPVDWLSVVQPSLFEITYSDSHNSAIKSFLEKNIELNLLIIDPGGCQRTVNQMITDGEVIESEARKIIAKIAIPKVNQKFMDLVLLGYVSSVEGYMRQLIRELVNLDKTVRSNCELLPINFGATYYQSHDMFPEALMEGISFASSNNIKKTCKDFLGVVFGNLKNNLDLKKALNDFESVCQIRHCVVHRFGKVGATNAIKLGMHEESFKDCLEKPLKMNFETIQKASKVTLNLVKEINQFIFEEIMKRLAKDDNFWTWDFRKDKKLFTKYMSVFYEFEYPIVNEKIKECLS